MPRLELVYKGPSMGMYSKYCERSEEDSMQALIPILDWRLKNCNSFSR